MIKNLTEVITFFKENKTAKIVLLIYSLIIIASTFVVFAIPSQQQINNQKVNVINEFISYPSHFQLDTLYRKSNDTLFIDTIKVKYLK